MSEPTTALVAVRLADQAKFHPDQDESHACSKCGATIVLYPSSRAALKANPDAVIICAVCIVNELKDDDTHELAAPIAVIAQEILDSRPVARCIACGASAPIGRIRCLKCGKPLVFPVR
jgi:hypothetical protein